MFNLTIQDHNGQVVNRVSFEQGSYVIGRLESCEVVLNSASVSRRHARIFVHAGRCYIEDMGSANGVIVDGQKVVGRRDLGTASQIRIGDFYLFLEFQRPGVDAGQRVLQTLFIPRGDDHHKLVRINDTFAGEEFVLSEVENSIGRTDENFILLSDPSISRMHGKILREGDRYTVLDLGSSNGSSVNGKPLTTPVVLKVGDRVKFGNVEFVFVAGDTKVDPRQYATAAARHAGGMTFAQIAGIAVIGLLCLALGGAMVYTFAKVKKGNAPVPDAQAPVATETPEDKAAAQLKAAQKAADRHDWAVAISAADEALAIKPDDEAAKTLKAKAEREQSAARLLAQGEELSEQGKHDEARKVLEKIPADSDTYKRAEPTLKHVRNTLAYNLKNEAQRLSKDRKTLLEAHQKAVASLEFSPGDAEILALIASLEDKLRKAKIKFTPYVAP
jgi:pSer/pThr/pTyr-binding forkhead associated (FHA) protein